ncbi:MAG: OBAP family protein [Nitrospirota bacterium]|nr:OBAP family protein [Nitrospirota bacterium]
MYRSMLSLFFVSAMSVLMFCGVTAPALSGGPGPDDGYDIHVQAPHLMPDGSLGAPFHHYCKGISDQILQCLLFETIYPKAPLVAIEYFVAKDLARKLPLIQWHRFFHDRKVEIATGRVQVLDLPEDEAEAVAEAASKTDGVIYHLWQKGKEFPDGTVTFPQSLGHSLTNRISSCGAEGGSWRSPLNCDRGHESFLTLG